MGKRREDCCHVTYFGIVDQPHDLRLRVTFSSAAETKGLHLREGEGDRECEK